MRQQQQAAAAAPAASSAATGTAKATTPSPNNGPRLKVELRKFSGEKADLEEWHKVQLSQARILGFAEELVVTDEIRVEAWDFNIRVSTHCTRSVVFPHYHLQRHGAGDRAEHRLA